MTETIAIIVAVVGGLATIGTTSYKCYQSYRERRQPNVIVEQRVQPSHRRDLSIDDIVLHELKKKRNSGDSDTSVDIKINIHTHEESEEGKL